MKRTSPLLLGCALAGTALSPIARAQDPVFLDWGIDMNSPKLNSAQPVQVKNLTRNNYVGFDAHHAIATGISLGWFAKNFNKRVRFELPNPGKTTPLPGPIAFGQPLAFYVEGGGYLVRENRTFGPSLGWSSKPVYEWCLVGLSGPTDGIGKNLKVGILNLTVKGFLVYQKRQFGIELGYWTYHPPLTPAQVAVAKSNPALRNYRSNHAEMAAFLAQLDRINPGEAVFLRRFFGVK